MRKAVRRHSLRSRNKVEDHDEDLASEEESSASEGDLSEKGNKVVRMRKTVSCRIYKLVE